MMDAWGLRWHDVGCARLRTGLCLFPVHLCGISYEYKGRSFTYSFSVLHLSVYNSCLYLT